MHYSKLNQFEVSHSNGKVTLTTYQPGPRGVHQNRRPLTPTDAKELARQLNLAASVALDRQNI